jgi:GT2 family glycosyltransferase
MHKKVAIIISPNYRDYAEKFLHACMEGVRAQDYEGEIKVFITDNETSPKSVKLLMDLAPEAELVLNKNNDGFAKGCNDSMRQALMQGFDYIFLVSIHSVLDKSCVSELVKALLSDEKIAVAQARLMLSGEENVLAGIGNATHYLGFGFSKGYREKWTGDNLEIKEVFYTSGASMFFRREALETVGLFDEEYWMYNEDQELPWRMRLAGFKAVVAPRAYAVTEYNFKRSIKKVYWMDRNRIISILICYKIPTFVLFLPAFLIMEIGQIVFSIANGWFLDKLLVYKYFLSPKTWFYLNKARRRNQALRKVSDRDILKMISGRISHQEFANDWKLKLINPIFDLYFKVAKRIIFW